MDKTIAYVGLAIVRYDDAKNIREHRKIRKDVVLLSELLRGSSSELLKVYPSSKAEFMQDLVVLSELKFKREGFFVEFGATNGVKNSNTCLLERHFGWTGILAEPAKRLHEDLKNNRSCSIETACVWRQSGSTRVFCEADIPEISTIESYKAIDVYWRHRRRTKKYSVTTISLEDLLYEYNASNDIDYLSLDTEGSEFDILSNFNFARYRFRVITCEHNFASQRENIRNLLSGHGYSLKYPHLSEVDDWYVCDGLG